MEAGGVVRTGGWPLASTAGGNIDAYDLVDRWTFDIVQGPTKAFANFTHW